MDPIPVEYKSLLRYDEQWQALICLLCNGGSAVGRQHLHRHLHVTHALKAKDYKPLIAALDSSKLPMLQSLDQFPCPLNDSSPVEGLPISKGLKCEHCGFLSTSVTVMNNHIRGEKQGSEERAVAPTFIHPGSQKVSLQTWSTHGWRGGYWTVIDPNDSFDAPIVTEPAVAMETPLPWLEQMVQMERQRLQAQEDDNVFKVTERHEKDDTSSWLMRTGWPSLFSGKDRILIGETRLLRTKNRRVHELSRIGESELLILNRVMDRIMDWGMDTLSSTPWGVRCWLRSPKHNEPDHRPFKKPQEKQTVIRYVSYWKQFICYCFRTGSLDAAQRRSIYGIEFTEEQERFIHEITELLRELDDQSVCEGTDGDEDENEEHDDQDESDDERDKGAQGEILDPDRSLVTDGPMDQIAERVFQLCISFLTQRFQNGEEPHSPLLHFSAVLGIDRVNMKFRSANNYTTILAGLIWV